MAGRSAPRACTTRDARRALWCVAAAGAIALSAGCGGASPERGDEVAPPRSMPQAEALLGAPVQLAEGETTLSLEVEAWRSFQPTMDTVPNRLIAVIRVHAARREGDAGRTGVPGALGLDAVWLLHGAEVVRGDAREEQPREPGTRTAEFVLRDGPLWPPGDSIDVVVSVTGVRGAPRLLRAPRIVIARVD